MSDKEEGERGREMMCVHDTCSTLFGTTFMNTVFCLKIRHENNYRRNWLLSAARY